MPLGVRLEVVRAAEGLVAHVTGEWLLAGVLPVVPLEFIGP